MLVVSFSSGCVIPNDTPHTIISSFLDDSVDVEAVRHVFGRAARLEK
jgi:hypothetical protein